MCVCAEHRADVGVRNFFQGWKDFCCFAILVWEREREKNNLMFIYILALSRRRHTFDTRELRYSRLFSTAASDDSHASHLISFEFHHIRILSKKREYFAVLLWLTMFMFTNNSSLIRASDCVTTHFFSFSRQLKSMLINGKVVRTYIHDREWDRTKIKHKKNAVLSSSPCSSVPVCICCVLLTQSS